MNYSYLGLHTKQPLAFLAKCKITVGYNIHMPNKLREQIMSYYTTRTTN